MYIIYHEFWLVKRLPYARCWLRDKWRNCGDHVRLTSSSPSMTRYFGAFVTKRHISANTLHFWKLWS